MEFQTISLDFNLQIFVEHYLWVLWRLRTCNSLGLFAELLEPWLEEEDAFARTSDEAVSPKRRGAFEELLDASPWARLKVVDGQY